MKIYDFDGNETDMAWLKSMFGPEIRVDMRPNLEAPGFEVAELRAAYGHSTLVVEVRDGKGEPLAGVHVARWWDDPTLGVLPNDLRTWQEVGVAGLTKPEGTIGFGMGSGDQYDWKKGQYAVSEVWCTANSGRMHGLGWPWGEDWHIDTIFQFSTDDPGPPPPSNGDEIDEALPWLYQAKASCEAAIRILEAA